jgi:hypothetical protein
MRTGLKKTGFGRHVGNKYSKVKHSLGDKNSFLAVDGVMIANKPQVSTLIEDNKSNTTNQQYVPNIKKSFILERKRKF